MRAILIILALFFLNGCTTIKPSVAQYSIVIDNLNTNSSALGCKEKSLKISNAFASSSLASHTMEYMESNNRVFAYTQSQWQESPSEMTELVLLKGIRESELFKSVHPSKSRIKSTLMLETNIEEFMQFFSEDLKESHVEVILNLSLIDAKTNSVLGSKTFRSRVETKSLDAKGGVEAFKSALSEIMSQNIEWLDGACR
ncbi:MAG: ABC-type transport auxiliary lipoprotein family protein [Sulfurimonas sp.]|uniref:ABC-type transport auxiliary lipoprotein family protein n=1 Tax=Sulfurimonas sp. TaxID=2022749 RepID=UPI0028CF7499|nr:ABC-type transport auxiliary lipoprotein family protein [Sulfurimonas sp.]MDT8338789.1 ABC-type transport auxiliary lipoprotein family protein [Sulfurimonas sp.]